MPSGNCNLQKCPHRPKMANSAYKGCECQVGKGSEEGRGDPMCPLHGTSLKVLAQTRAQFTNYMYNHFR